MIDEYESEYAPDTDMGPRNQNEEIGEFTALAFMKKRTFLKNVESVDMAKKQAEEEERKLLAEGKRKIEVVCNTKLMASNNYTFIMDLNDRVFSIFDLISAQRSSNKKVGTQRFIVMECVDSDERATKESVMLEETYNMQNPIGTDSRVVDPDSLVRNLKSNRIEIREKIFADKKKEKQLEITLELQNELKLEKKSSNKDEVERKNSFDEVNPDLEERKSSQVQEWRREEDFLFGQISGSKLQEFRVHKVNRKGKYAQRILCIDGSSFSHKKVEKKPGFFGSMVPKGLLNSSAAKLKPIAQIHDVARHNTHEFSIFYKDAAKDEEKQYRYRCENPDQCSEILAKLKFLVGDSIVKKTGARMLPGTYQQRPALRGYF